MTYEEMCRHLARRTGLSYRTVRAVLDEQSKLISKAVKDGREVHFRGVLKLRAYRREVPARDPSSPLGQKRSEVRLRAWLMPALRKEVAVDKYGVGTDDETVKTAEKGRNRACPSCGSTHVDYSNNVPHCPQCGTKPWESHASRSEEAARR